MPQNRAIGCADGYNEDVRKNSIFDELPDTLILVNRLGTILLYKPSKEYERLFPADTAAGRYFSAVLPADAVGEAIDAVSLALDSGKLQTFEFSWTEDYSTMHFEARVTTTGEEDTLIIIRDISEWRRVEAYDLLLLDMAVKVQEERSMEEILSMTCTRITSIFDLPLAWAAYRESDTVNFCTSADETTSFLRENGDVVVEGEGPTGTALRTGRFQLMETGDPRMQPLRAVVDRYGVATGAAFPLKVGGRILGALTIFAGNREFWTKRALVQFTNLAEQVALAIHLVTNRQRIKLLTTGLRSAANAVVITSRRGSIEWVNPAFLQLNGYKASEVIGGNIRMLESGQHPRSFYKAMWQYISAGRIWHGEITQRRKDGSFYTAEMTITPVRDDTGKVANYISVISDISERRQAECVMLEAREAMARAEKMSALGIMAAGIAHEINQPLNSLKVLADGMLYWYSKGKVPDIGSAMENIREMSKDAERIADIIKHMRSFLSNDQEEAQPCDINLAVEKSLLLLGMQLNAHNIEIHTGLTANLPVMGNAIQMEQVVINLLVNAMHSLDTVDKPDKHINIFTASTSDSVVLEISDNGPGIDKKIKNKIFDPFVTTKSVDKGMGLGLSVVHAIVTAYGGNIKVMENLPGDGATLRIELPALQEERKGAVSK